MRQIWRMRRQHRGKTFLKFKSKSVEREKSYSGVNITSNFRSLSMRSRSLRIQWTAGGAIERSGVRGFNGPHEEACSAPGRCNTLRNASPLHYPWALLPRQHSDQPFIKCLQNETGNRPSVFAAVTFFSFNRLRPKFQKSFPPMLSAHAQNLADFD